MVAAMFLLQSAASPIELSPIKSPPLTRRQYEPACGGTCGLNIPCDPECQCNLQLSFCEQIEN